MIADCHIVNGLADKIVCIMNNISEFVDRYIVLTRKDSRISVK